MVCDVGAVIVAAGRGTRMRAGGRPVNKLHIDICGATVLERALSAFFASGAIREVVLVAAAGDVDYCRREYPRLAGGKRFAVVAGGATRQESVANGVMAVGPGCGIIAVHDGARPFIRGREIEAGAEAAARSGASCVAVRATDTIKIADGAFIRETPERSSLWAAQTPQTFRRELLLEALQKAERDGFAATDDASLAERLGVPVEIVEGSYDNIKITTPADIAAAREIAARILDV